MQLTELTLPIPACSGGNQPVSVRELVIASGGTRYTGMVYDFAHDSMVGTYIDFPGHIKETDDGLCAAS